MIKVKRNFLDRAISFVSPERGLRRMAARTRLELANSYRGADSNRLRADWVITQDDAATSSWELRTLRERSRDLNRNDPVASGATETMSINIVGQGLRPQSRIRAEYVGMTEEKVEDLQRLAEMIWQEWSRNADSTNRMDFDEIQFLAIRKIIEDGETLAIPIMVNDEWRTIKRAIEVIEADRLSNPMSKAGMKNDSGIKVGERGEPKIYYIQKANNIPGSVKHTEVKAMDRMGRPRILHVFPIKRPGQLRGVPFFAPVLSYFKDLSDYLEAEVVAARVAACLAVFVTKENPYDAAYGASSGTEADTGHRLQSLEPGLISYLNTGESIGVVDPKRPGDSFAPFVEGVLRMIGMSLNLPYELLAKDFSKTNYSSARAALLEARRMFLTWRGWFARRFCQPIWDLIMEEAYLRGMFDVPDFYKFKSEYTRASWIGGGWGWVDPVKEVEAARKAIDYGLSTLAEETASQGRSWEDVLEQQAREKKKIEALGADISRATKGEKDNAHTKEE